MTSTPPDETNPSLERLDALIGRYAREPLPPVPGNLESRVWREIRARRARGHASTGADWLARLLNWWREPRLAFAGFLAAAAIGVSMSWSNAVATQASSTRQALDLGVFSTNAPALPSTLLARANPRH